MIELNDFFNEGQGWVCRHCDTELATKPKIENRMPRFFREGEAESKQPVMSNAALAKWADPAHRTLVCPLCGITELVDIS
jgi:rubrerythrin